MNPTASNATRAFSRFRQSGVRFGATSGEVSCGTLTVTSSSDGGDSGDSGTPDQQQEPIPLTYYYAGAGVVVLLLLLS